MQARKGGAWEGCPGGFGFQQLQAASTDSLTSSAYGRRQAVPYRTVRGAAQDARLRCQQRTEEEPGLRAAGTRH